MQGFFGWLPKALRLWFFARLNPQQLPKLRVNKALQKFIDDEVYPYIEVQLVSLLDGRPDYERQQAVLCRQCDCRVRRAVKMVGVRKVHFFAVSPYVYSFALHPEERQPSGHCNLSALGDLSDLSAGTFDGSTKISAHVSEYEPFILLGLCYRCVLVNGLAPDID